MFFESAGGGSFLDGPRAVFLTSSSVRVLSWSWSGATTQLARWVPTGVCAPSKPGSSEYTDATGRAGVLGG